MPMPQGAERCAVFCLHCRLEQGTVVQASRILSRCTLLSWPGRGEFCIDGLQVGACLQRGRCTREMVAGHGEVTPLTVQLNRGIRPGGIGHAPPHTTRHGSPDQDMHARLTPGVLCITC